MDKKKIIFLSLFFSLFPFFSFAQSLSGLFFDWVVGAITYLPSLIIIIVIQLAVLVAAILAQIFGMLLLNVVNPDFIQWSYTNVGLSEGDLRFNPIVAKGLEITRGFISIGLVLVLIYIAIATILRLAGYETKKLLANLFIVALLVNFAPVICGLIIDFFNVFMFYFTEKIGGLNLIWNVLRDVAGNIISAFLAIKVTAQAGLIGNSFILISYCLFYLFIVLAFVLSFVFRYVALWIAVILSPLAFVCWILPATKKYWEFWWKEFLGWCMLGPIMAFFLYLGSEVAKAVGVLNIVTSLQNLFLGYAGMSNVFAHSISLGFLYLGYILAQQGKTIGVDVVFRFAGKGMDYFRQSPIFQRPMGWVAEKGAQAITSRPVTWLGEKMGKVPVIGQPMKTVFVSYPSEAAKAFLGYAQKTRQVEIMPGFENLTPQEQERLISTLTPREKIFYAQKAAQLGTLQKMKKETKEAIMADLDNYLTSPYYKKQLGDIFKAMPEYYTRERAIRLGINPAAGIDIKKATEEVEKTIGKFFEGLQKATQPETNPELRKEVEKIAQTTGKTIDDVLKDISLQMDLFRKMKPQDIKDLSPESVKSVGFRLSMPYLAPNQMANFIENFDRDTIREAFQNPGGLNQIFLSKKTLEERDEVLRELYQQNPSLIRWFFINPTGRLVDFAAREVVQKKYKSFEKFEESFGEAQPKIITPGMPEYQMPQHPIITPPPPQRITPPPPKKPPRGEGGIGSEKKPPRGERGIG
jgi:hypothetical protein